MREIQLLSVQILVLTLYPLLSGVVPEGHGPLPLALLGLEESLTADYLEGTWQWADDFTKWGVTDKEKAKIRPYKGKAFLSLNKDGTVKMVNLFKPESAKWSVCPEGIVIYDNDPKENSSRILPIRKRGKDRIWVILPFTGGSAGIGMVRVSPEEVEKERETVKLPQQERTKQQPVSDSHKRSRYYDSQDTGLNQQDPFKQPITLETAPPARSGIIQEVPGDSGMWR